MASLLQGDASQPKPAITASIFVTRATFCIAYSIDARCQLAFMVEQPSSGKDLDEAAKLAKSSARTCY